MMMLRVLTLTAVATFVAGASARAQQPDSALAAEADGRWDDAIRIHRSAIALDSRRADLWIRIADIEARRGNLSGCIDALQQAADAAPANASIYFRLSQAYSTAGHPTAALKAIEGALMIEPDAAAYLRAHAVLSTWLNDYQAAQHSYRRLAILEPDHADTILSLARVSSWAGDTDEAAAQYKKYLGIDADNEQAWIELARVESWRGNYGAAVQALTRYRQKFGDTAAYAAAYAQVMAAAGRPGRARAVLEPLLADSPASVELNLTRTIALALQRHTREAFSSLDTVRALAPTSQDTRSAEKVVRTMLASTAEPSFTLYSDSDRLRVERFSPRAAAVFASGSTLSAGMERSRLSATAASGLGSPDGSSSVDFEHSWVGAAQKLGAITFELQAGYAKAAAHEQVTYRAGFDLRASDAFAFAAERSVGAVVISPRTVGLGLTQVGHRVQIQWAPTLQSMVGIDAQIQDLSDGNRRLELTVSPRRSVVRRAGFNLDLGASFYRLSTQEDLANGYYDPRRYEHVAATAFPYFKISENVGLSLSAAVGVQRDYERAAAFQFGGSISGEATFGIYQPWMLKVSGSASRNRRLESGAFTGMNGGVALVRRF